MSMLERAGENCYRIPRRGKMRVEVRVYLNHALYRSFTEEESLEQLVHAASLPGVQEPVIGMPDLHTGFGLPIGGVMAMDPATGLVSAGAVGMDINCGVRLLSTNIPARSLDKPVLRKLMQAVVRRVPSGVGQKSRQLSLVRDHFPDFAEKGAPYLVGFGFGRPDDISRIEDGGSLAGADLKAVSREAIDRGLQLSTIGGGNHFVEFGCVEGVADRDTAARLGLEEGSLTVLIHTGSRGFGHQICTDFSKSMLKEAARINLDLPSPGLAAVPIGSAEGRRYLAAMACAVNIAFCNRQWIAHDVRQAFAEVLGGNEEDYGLELVYDLAHNIAKFEEVGGRRLLIHRKGATRALPAGHPANPAPYRQYGHPVLIPGSMGTASYVAAAEPAVERTFFSVNHGAGRVLSRRAARREITVSDFQESMSGVLILGRNVRDYLDEAPQAYKDIDAVTDTLAEIGLTRKVARLKPLAVIKGEGKES